MFFNIFVFVTVVASHSRPFEEKIKEKSKIPLSHAISVAFEAVELSCNGLREADVNTSPFPVDESFILTWLAKTISFSKQETPDAFSVTPMPNAFEVSICDEYSNFQDQTFISSSFLNASKNVSFTWSSGRIESNQSLIILPKNATSLLLDASTYKWRVRIWNSTAVLPKWSQVASFDTAPSALQWKNASWIGGASQLRTDWTLPSSPSIIRARAYASGLGAFELHINGIKVSNHIMDPGESVYDQRVLFVGYNVTKLLHPGKVNTIGALLGNSKFGYLDIYANRTAVDDQSGDSTRAFILLLIVTLSDGTELELTSTADPLLPSSSISQWRCRHGPIVYDHLWHGEIYDSRRETFGSKWDAAPLVNYSDTTWSTKVQKMKPNVGYLYPQLMPGIRITKTYQPIHTTRRSSVCSPPMLGGSAEEGESLYLACTNNEGVIETIEFVSYGTPLNRGNSDCNLFEKGSCAAQNVLTVVQNLCQNKSSCVVNASNSLFDGGKDPCKGVRKTLVIRARGSVSCIPAPPPPIAHANSSTVYDFGQNMQGFTSLTVDPSFLIKSLQSNLTLKILIKHTEIVDESGEVYNNFYPGMEFNHASKTCSMKDWYARKWYECANQTDAFIFELSPKVRNESKVIFSYTPTFTYHGFRFAEVKVVELMSNGIERPFLLLFPGIKLQAHRVQTDVYQLTDINLQQSIGSSSNIFQTADIIGKIFNMTISSHVSQLWSIPTDCPQREKRGWMGDAGITSSSLQTFYDTYAFHTNFLRLIADNQKKMCTSQPVTTIYGPCHEHSPAFYNGSVPDVTPFSTGPYGGNPGSTDWQAAFIMIARNLLRHYGTLTVPFLTGLWPQLELLMEYFERNIDPSTGLLLKGARGDWVPPIGHSRSTSTKEVSAFFHTLCVAYMAEIAQAIGHSDDERRYTARLEANRKAYHNKFFNHAPKHYLVHDAPRLCCYGTGSQTSNIFALHIGAVPDSIINDTVKALVYSIQHHDTSKYNVSEDNDSPPWGDGPHLDMGIFGTTFIFETLHALGYDSIGFDILNQTTYPSFGYMMSQNGTTLWEGWTGTAHSIGQATSRNHIMFGGGVNRFIAGSIAGLTIATHPGANVETAGWRQVLVRPSPKAIRSLSRANIFRRTPQGYVSVSWQRFKNYQQSLVQFDLNLTIPYGTIADVEIPFDAEQLTTTQTSWMTRTLSINDQCEVQCKHNLEAIANLRDCDGINMIICKQRLDGDLVFKFTVKAGNYGFQLYDKNI